MAITPTFYATAVEYRARINKTDTSGDSIIESDLTAISRFLDSKLGRFFGKDSEDATRLYISSEASNRLRIDDLSATPTSIKIDEDADGDFDDETALASSDFELHPLNAQVGPESRPFTQIVLTPWRSNGFFSPGVRVQVVGLFGWPAVPKAIQQATIDLTAILRLESNRATNRIPEIEVGAAIETSPDGQRILHNLFNNYYRTVYV